MNTLIEHAKKLKEQKAYPRKYCERCGQIKSLDYNEKCDCRELVPVDGERLQKRIVRTGPISRDN